MENEMEIVFWDDLKIRLKHKYPLLTNSDLVWRHSSREDLLEMIALKLGKTYKELQVEIEMI